MLYRIINITTVSVTIHDRVGFTRVISCLKQEEYARMKKKELWESSVKCDCMLYWSSGRVWPHGRGYRLFDYF